MNTEAEQIVIRPQPGMQERALKCPADILIAGGSAGSGKTVGLLVEPLRHIHNHKFMGVIFRRICPNITNEGAMWDESTGLYGLFHGAEPNLSNLTWTFPGGSRIHFAHLQRAVDVLNWKGSQIPFLGFDQLEEFEESQFWYMVSRNRSLCGVKPYVRATVNPVPADDKVGGWVHKLISWWLNEQTGFTRPERDGVLRWFIRPHEQLQWYDTRKEAVDAAIQAGFSRQQAEDLPKSFTFIEGKLEDNKILMEKDPSYYANLMILPKVDRDRLYHRNWNSKITAGEFFNRAWFKIVQAVPTLGMRWVRYWDKAGTEGGGKRTAGVKLGYHQATGLYYVADSVVGQWSFYHREAVIKQIAELDGYDVPVRGEQEPGSSGKDVANYTIKNLAGWNVKIAPSTGDKFTRAKPFCSQAQAGNVVLVAGPWNEAYLTELHAAEPGATFLDQMDASSGAFNCPELRGVSLDAVPVGGNADEEQGGLHDEDEGDYREGRDG